VRVAVQIKEKGEQCTQKSAIYTGLGGAPVSAMTKCTFKRAAPFKGGRAPVQKVSKGKMLREEGIGRRNWNIGVGGRVVVAEGVESSRIAISKREESFEGEFRNKEVSKSPVTGSNRFSLKMRGRRSAKKYDFQTAALHQQIVADLSLRYKKK